MTIDQFRANPALTEEMRGFFKNATVALAISALKDSFPRGDAPLASAEVASVRVLSQRAGHELAIETFLSLASPASDIADVGEATWEDDKTRE